MLQECAKRLNDWLLLIEFATTVFSDTVVFFVRGKRSGKWLAEQTQLGREELGWWQVAGGR